MFHNGLSIQSSKKKQQLLLVAIDNGVLTGRTAGLPLPTLIGGNETEAGQTWITTPHDCTLLLCRGDRFALVTGATAEEPALSSAEEALHENIDDLIRTETERRGPVARLFSINSRHNPPVALAAETLHQRLRGPVAGLHGLWSTSDGFSNETFWLNDLYPLTRAWILTDPKTAMQLVQTALSLQQPAGGFPAWVNARGETATAAAWPMIIQTFEAAWTAQSEPGSLQKHLPALRKTMQWALRYFDPHRDLVPAWQHELEVFVPGSFERSKATPDLTVMLLAELAALKRLCQQSEHTQVHIDPLEKERLALRQTLETIFWNPETKAFSNVWKDGHTLHDPSFASFTPLLLPDLPASFKTPLLEHFDQTHSFPGQKRSGTWKREPIDDSAQLPAIHQFTTFEALHRSNADRALLALFVRRTREGVAAWFERERIDTARHEANTQLPDRHVFSLGPITAALILVTQNEFQHEAVQSAPVRKTMQRWADALKIRPMDLYIIMGTLLAILMAHLLYNITRPPNEDALMAEASLDYEQGRFVDALNTCRIYPNHPVSNLLLANLYMRSDRPAEAEKLYLNVLKTDETHLGSPSAMFGYCLALQLNGNLDLAIRRYNDFIDIHEDALSQPGADLIDFAYLFLRLAEEGFTNPPKWKQIYALPTMNDLGL
jgi:hypothetical protein